MIAQGNVWLWYRGFTEVGLIRLWLSPLCGHFTVGNVVAQIHFAGVHVGRQFLCSQEVVRAVHAAFGGRFFVFVELPFGLLLNESKSKMGLAVGF